MKKAAIITAIVIVMLVLVLGVAAVAYAVPRWYLNQSGRGYIPQGQFSDGDGSPGPGNGDCPFLNGNAGNSPGHGMMGDRDQGMMNWNSDQDDHYLNCPHHN
ncbi:MAG: hypothetical protein M1371_11040 [Actinobacteria bacterium]|nr:hypothetical protein [Actinomycetota bacterium]